MTHNETKVIIKLYLNTNKNVKRDLYVTNTKMSGNIFWNCSDLKILVWLQKFLGSIVGHKDIINCRSRSSRTISVNATKNSTFFPPRWEKMDSMFIQ